MMWDGHSQEKGIGSSVVDRGYTDYSKEFQLKQSLLVDYQQWDFPEPYYNSRPRPEDRFPNSKFQKALAASNKKYWRRRFYPKRPDLQKLLKVELSSKK